MSDSSMPVKDALKVSRKTFFNPSAWLGYGQLKESTSAIWGVIKTLFVPAKPQRTETFEEAMVRFNVTEDELKEKQNVFLTYAYGFVLFAVCSFVIGFFLLIHHKTVLGWLLALAVTTLFLSQAFRYHFWYFQIKNRKLGCTFKEWRQGKVNPTEEPK
jgi:intracellular multiplication protein IcmV